MKKTVLISAAVSGLLLGTAAASLNGCTSETKPGTTSEAALPKHACKGYNDCKNQGGCKTGDQGCRGKNTCKQKGGCATVEHHGCKGQNTCKGLGGCGGGDNGCKAKNSCKGKGGCAVPIRH